MRIRSCVCLAVVVGALVVGETHVSLAATAVVTVPTSWTHSGWWVNTGLSVVAGDVVHVTAAGSWLAWARSSDWCGANGCSSKWYDQFLNAYYGAANAHLDNFAALIAYIGTTPPAVGSYSSMTQQQRLQAISRMVLLGSEVTITVQQAGPLWLGMNDDAYSGNDTDNAGKLTVSLTIGGGSVGLRTLTVSATAGGSVVVSGTTRSGMVAGPGAEAFVYPHGEAVQLEAKADSGCLFTGWSGATSGPKNPIWFIMDGDYTISADFGKNDVVKGIVTGYEKDDSIARGIGGVKIEVQRHKFYGEPGMVPLWEGVTNADGSYETAPIPPQPFSGHTYDYVTASLDGKIVQVKNWRTNKTIAKTRQIGSNPRIDFVFGEDSSPLLPSIEKGGVRAFREIQKAQAHLSTVCGYDKTSAAMVYVFDDPCPSGDCRARMKPVTGTIYLPVRVGVADTWHEYGHFVHRQTLGSCDFICASYMNGGFVEGWGHYFGAVGAGLQASVRETNQDITATRKDYPDGPDSECWGLVYAGVFRDIWDGTSQSDGDNLDGEASYRYPKMAGGGINGAQMVWAIIMGEQVTDIEAFYWSFRNKYTVSPHGRLHQALDGIWRTHGLPVPTRSVASGHIPPAGTTTTTTLVDSSVTASQFSVSWPGSDLDLTLTSPTGRTIDPAYAAADPNVIYVEGTTEEYYTIEHPELGEWQMHVTAVDVPPEGESYTLSTDLTTNLMLILSVDKGGYNLKDPIATSVEVLYDANSYAGPNVEAQVQTPQGMETLTLFDDGLHNDGNNADGVYGNTFSNTAVEGQYVITATATGLNPFGEPFVRQTSRTVLVQNLPDLEPVDLTGVSGPARGQMTLMAHVRNNGTKDAGGIAVGFYDTNDVNTPQIGADIVIEHLGPGEVKEVSTIWDTSEGLHNVVAVVDYNNVIAEGDETNNALSAEFEIAATPVAQWAFDEASGTKASDSAGSSPGTVYGAKWVQGRIGQALRFDGWDDYVDCGKAAVLAPEKMTVALWVYVEGKAAFQYPLGKAADLAPSKDYTLMTSSEGKLEFAFGESGFQQVAVRAGTALPVGQWVHVVATRDGSTASLYVNGQLAGSASYSFSVTNKGQPLRIGSIGSPDSVGFFKGKLDDVRIYDKALLLEEVQELYSQP